MTTVSCTCSFCPCVLRTANHTSAQRTSVALGPLSVQLVCLDLSPVKKKNLLFWQGGGQDTNT